MKTTCIVALITVPLFAAGAAAVDPEWTLLRPGNTGITGDYTHTIFIDTQDRPWVAGYIPFWEEGGLAYHDGTRWVPISSVDYPVITSPRFNDIVYDDSRDLMWIGSNNGLLRMCLSEGPDSLVRFHTGNTPLPGNQISGLALEPDGTLWIADQEFGGSAAGGLVRLDPDTLDWTVWTTTTPEPLPWGPDWPGWDWVDWVETIPDGVGGQMVWFGSNEMGIAILHDGVFTWIDNDNPPPGIHPLKLMSQNAGDDDGNIWVLTNEGLARRAIDGTYTVVGFPAGLTTEVSRVTAISGGRAVLGTFYADVFIWDGAWTYIGNWGSGNHTYTFAEDSKGRLWAGGIGGASVYDGTGWQRHRLTNSGMVGYSIESISFAANGDVYMNGNAGAGVGGFDIYHGPDLPWTNANDATYGIGLPWGIPSDNCASVYPRANGNILVAPSGGQGLFEWDGVQYIDLIPQYYNIEHVVEDAAGRIWAARGNGLDFIDEEGVWQSFFGAPMPGGAVSDLIVDPDQPGFIWAVTPFGLAHTDGVTWDIHPRGNLDLVQNTTGHHFWCADRAADGTFWIGTGIGLYHYDPVAVTYTRYDLDNTPEFPSDDFHTVNVAPDSSVWAQTFDATWPYPGGVSHLDGSTWTTYSANSSPLPHNQIYVMRSRAILNGYELWIGTASEAIAIVTVMNDTEPADLNGDGVVGIGDLILLLANWGPCGGCPADLNGDGIVNTIDLLALFGAWS